MKSGRFEEAVEFAQQVVDLQPTATHYALLGASLSQAEKPDQANDAFEQAAKLDPNSAKHQYNIAANCYRFGWKAEAAKYVRKALQIDPSHPKALFLSERLEKENQAAKTVLNPILNTEKPEPPPLIGTEAPGTQSNVWNFAPPVIVFSHSVRWIEKMGKAWGALLWIFYSIEVVMLISLYSFMFQPVISGGTDQFFEFGSKGGLALLSILVWMINTVAWIFDLIDRRPQSGPIAVSVGGMIFTLPLFLSCMFPIFGIFAFPIYFTSTRSGRN